MLPVSFPALSRAVLSTVLCCFFCGAVAAQCVRPELVMINPCVEHDNPNGSGLPVQSEFLILRTGGAEVPVNRIGIDVPFNGFGAVNADLGYDSNGAPYGCDFGPPSITSLPGCPQAYPLGPADVLPPNALVVVFLMSVTTTNDLAETDFSNICTEGTPVVILQSDCARTAGAFADGPGQGDPLRSVGLSAPCGPTVFTYNTTELNPADGTYFLVGPSEPGNLDCDLPVLPPTCPPLDTTFLLCDGAGTAANPLPIADLRAAYPPEVLFTSFHPSLATASLNEDRLVEGYVYPGAPDTLYARIIYAENLCIAVGTLVVRPNGLVGMTCGEVTAANPQTANGTVTLRFAGGTPPYDVTYAGAAAGAVMGQNSPLTVTGLAAGEYTFSATDAAGCPVPACTATVPEEQGLVIDCRVRNEVGTNVRGSLAVSINSGQAPFLVELIRPSGTVTAFPDQPLGEFSVGNLGAGDYAFRVTDALGNVAVCELTLSEVTCPLALDQISLLNVACTGGGGTVVRLGIAGNQGAVTTVWSGPNGVEQFNGLGEAGPLPPGPYAVTVSDAAGCTVSSGQIIVLDLGAPAYSVFGDVITSPCRDDAAVEVIGLFGGQAPYTVILFDEATDTIVAQQINVSSADSVLFTGLTANDSMRTVGVAVFDASGCAADTSFVDLFAGSAPDLRLDPADQNITPPTCAGEETAGFTLVPAGGAAPYAVEYLSSPYDGSDRELAPLATQTGVRAGTYRVLLTDANGCTGVAEVTVPEAAEGPFLSCAEATAAVTGGTGSLRAIITAGEAPYRLRLSGLTDTLLTLTAAGEVIVGDLLPDDYSVMLADNRGCTADTCTTTLTASACPLTADFQLDTAGCATDPRTITVVPNGTGPFMIDWAADTLPDALTINVGSNGTYALRLTDAVCALDTFVVLDVTARNPPKVNFAFDTLTSCGPDGLELPLVFDPPLDRSFDLSYDLTHGGTTDIFIDVPVGPNDPLRLDPADLPPGLSLLTITAIRDGSCRQDRQASLVIRRASSDTVRTFGPVCAASREVGGRLFDAQTPRDTFTTGEGACGTVYEVDLQFGVAQAVDTLDIFVCAGDSLELNGERFFAARPEGEVRYERPNECDSVVYVRIEQPEVTVGTFGRTACAGDTVFYANRAFTEEEPGGVVRLPGAAADGCDSLVVVQNTFRRTGTVRLFGDFTVCRGDSIDLRFTYDGPGGIDVVVVDDAGFSYPFANIRDNDRRTVFPTGSTNYRLVSAVAGACGGSVAGSASVVVNDLELEVMTLVDPTNFCVDTLGVVVAAASGGTPPYRYAWSNGSPDSLLRNLTDATYAVTLIDGDGCELSDSVAIASPEPIVLQLRGLPPTCPGETGELTVDSVGGGAGFYEVSQNGEFFVPLAELGRLDFAPGTGRLIVQDAADCRTEVTYSVPPAPPLPDLPLRDTTIRLGDSLLLLPGDFPDIDTAFWTPPTGLSDPGALTTVARPERTTDFSLHLRTAAGCTYELPFRLTVDRRLPVYAPSAFSPNGDAVNDRYELGLSELVTAVTSFQIFNRWGELLHDNPGSWDGQLDGQPAPPAVYVFRATVLMADNSVRTITGDFVLMR